MILDEIAEKYRTDKRSTEHNYTPFYEKYFDEIRDKKIKILEIGIYRPPVSLPSPLADGRHDAASLKTWYEYFPNAEIYGVDLNDFKYVENDRIKTMIADQGKREKGGLSDIVEVFGGEYDIIIDDGGHTMQQQLVTLGYLFEYLKSDGIFVIEDLHTSYMRHYNPTHTDRTTIEVLREIEKSNNVESEFIKDEEKKYLEEHINTCDIMKGTESEIAFITKK